MMTFSVRAPRPASVVFNALALLALCVMLGLALVWEFAYGHAPDSSGQLQRLAYLLAGAGLLLNLRFGPSPVHYALVLAAALGGTVAAGSQVLSRLAPGAPALSGPQASTWALAGYAALLVYCTFMLALDRKASDNAMPRRVGVLTALPMWLFLIVALAATTAAGLRCGVSACPAPGEGYAWLAPEWEPVPVLADLQPAARAAPAPLAGAPR
ncbi:disulfide bond formation protein DsbB [Achromobacter aloeverae]|uniref:disulfide bond formation protein DsbB n=1 Tax=Achromobacter aloeverae TaxID=1750518 RepID=UPI001F02A9E5|nr:disulfide bond formation protein DsbB [Achromobacter aloeverae]